MVDRVELLDENEFGKKVKVLDKNGNPVQVRQYHYTNTKGDKIVIQEHSLGHSKATPLHGDVPHFNVRPASNLNTGSYDGTHGHYNF
ncbi:TPA: hypothetical protein RSW55_004209 [Vibrio vulnificus]|nr:hypothetical protein [Vibrio vulnificus]